MKINFEGIYKDIKRLVDAPIQPDVKAPTEHRFEDVLASISPFHTKKPNEIELIKQAETLNEQDSDIFGKIHLPSPEQKTPDLELIQTPGHLNEETDSADSGVKTPSILEAHRLKPDAAFTKLHKSQRIEEVKKMVEVAGMEHGIDPVLSMSVVSAESAFNSNAVSSDGHASKGLFQLLDTTGTDVMARAGLKSDYNPFDPKLNVKLGVSYLRYLHEIFSSPTDLPNNLKTVAAANSASLEKLAVAAFNAGEGRVASAQARASKEGLDPSQYENVEAYLPEITKEYVKKVQQQKGVFAEKFRG